MKSVSPLHDTRDARHEEWVPLLDTAAREVFEIMMGTRVTVFEGAGCPILDTTSMVGLAGRLAGVMSVRCDSKAAALMASKMLGVDLDKVGPELFDAVGEVCNMIAGNFKNKIAGLADGCMLSPPTVVTGTDYQIHSLAEGPEVGVKLAFEGMPVVVSLEIHN